MEVASLTLVQSVGSSGIRVKELFSHEASVIP